MAHSIIYSDLIKSLVVSIEDFLKDTEAINNEKKVFFNKPKENNKLEKFRQNLEGKDNCPICKMVFDSEKLYILAFAEYIRKDEEFKTQYKESGFLCIPHGLLLYPTMVLKEYPLHRRMNQKRYSTIRKMRRFMLTAINKSMLLGYPICIIMADIDFFKKVNDTYGHAIGDNLLRDFAQILKETIRKGSDWVARYGGEEFLIVANGTDPKGGYKLAEKIRRKVEEKLFEYGDIKIRITASFGVHCIKNLDMDVGRFIEFADKNLYDAKRSGRNRMVGCKNTGF